MRVAATLIPVAILSGPAAAEPDARRVVSDQQLRVLMRSNPDGVADLVVRGDVNLGRLEPARGAAGGTLRFRQVAIEGAMRGAPAGPISFVDGNIGSIAPGGASWRFPAEFRNAHIGRVLFRDTRVSGWNCRGCTITMIVFEGAYFEGEADFSDSVLGASAERPGANAVSTGSRPLVSFHEATFAGPARFDGTRIDTRQQGDPTVAGAMGKPVFTAASFLEIARFPEMEAPGGINFRGTRFAKAAIFTRCSLRDAVFGRGTARHLQVAEFEGIADFGGCRLTGKSQFERVVFRGNARFARAKLSGLLSFDQSLPLNGLDLRGISADCGPTDVKGDCLQILLSPPAAEGAQVSWQSSGAALLRGVEAQVETDDPTVVAEGIDVLESLAGNLASRGEAQAALVVGHKVRKLRRGSGLGSPADAVAAEAAWWLWGWPTSSGSDPLRPLGLLGLLFLGLTLLGTVAGRFVWFPASRASAAPRSFEPVREADTETLGAQPAQGWPGRGLAAFAFAALLLFKLEPVRVRWAGGDRHITLLTLGLWAVWLLGWGLLALALAALVASQPTLSALIA